MTICNNSTLESLCALLHMTTRCLHDLRCSLCTVDNGIPYSLLEAKRVSLLVKKIQTVELLAIIAFFLKQNYNHTQWCSMCMEHTQKEKCTMEETGHICLWLTFPLSPCLRGICGVMWRALMPVLQSSLLWVLSTSSLSGMSGQL